MPARKKKPLPILARIREAERNLIPVHRETIGMDAAALDTVAELVERGVGTKSVVLRQALATGLRVLRAGTEPPPTEENAPLGDGPWTFPEGLPEDISADVPLTTNGLVGGAVAPRLFIAPAIDTPPSRLRSDAPPLDDDDDQDAT